MTISKEVDSMGISEAVVLDSIYKYGEKAYILLKAAYEVYQSNLLMNRKVPGDFDYKSLINKLREKGVSYNPNQLLRMLEREFGIIETTYRSVNQRWWRFKDPLAISKALSTYEGKDVGDECEDPEILLLKIQVEVIDIDKLINELIELISKERLTLSDRERIKNLIFNDAQLIIKLFKETQKYGEEFREFNSKANLFVKYLTVVAKKLKGINLDVITTQRPIDLESMPKLSD